MAAISFGVPFCVGNNVSLVGVTAMTINSTGGASFSTGVDLKSAQVWDMGEFSADLNLALIKPADATMANYVKLFDDWEFRVGEIAPAGSLAQLEGFWTAFDNVRCSMQTRNPWATASVSNFVVYGIRSHFERHWVEDKQALVLVVRPIGILPQWTTGTPLI